MIRSVTAAAALAAVAGAALVAAPATASSTRKTCLHAGEQVIKRGAEAEVVATKPVSSAAIRGDRAFLCRFSTKQRLRIGTDNDLLTRKTLQVSGLFAAYENAYNADGVEAGTVLMLRSFVKGHRRQVIDSGYPSDQAGAFSAIVLRPTGSVAYIGHHDYAANPGVYRCQPVGCGTSSTPAPERLADGAGLALTSLRATTTGISWMQNGTRRTASLK